MTDDDIIKLAQQFNVRKTWAEAAEETVSYKFDAKGFAHALLSAADLDARNRVAEALGLPGNGLRDGKRVSFAWEYLLGLIADMAKDDEPVTARN